jgi:hypothetical protein
MRSFLETDTVASEPNYSDLDNQLTILDVKGDELYCNQPT